MTVQLKPKRRTPPRRRSERHPPESLLETGLRLNRLLAFMFLLYEAWLLRAMILSGRLESLAWGADRLALMFLLTLGVLWLNEKALSRCLRFRGSAKNSPEAASRKRFPALVATWTGASLTLSLYVLSGQWGMLLFGLAAVLQMQMLGRRLSACLMFTACILLYALGLPPHYPALIDFPQSELKRACLSLAPILMPLALTFILIGDRFGRLLWLTSDRVSHLQSLATTDGLTGLINRRQFNRRLDAEVARAGRYRSPLSLALFDIDDFKRINDTYGHPAGDRILRELSGLLIANVRESDVPARYGGEEFALILPETTQVDAHELLERLRALVEHSTFCMPDNPMQITVSIGIAQLNWSRCRAGELIAQADVALYEAKRQGKNRVVRSLPTAVMPPLLQL